MKTFLVLLFALFLLGCSPQQISCNSQNLTKQNQCFIANALQLRSRAICDNINDIYGFVTGVSRLQCYLGLAVKTNNVSLCSIVTRYNSAATCIRQIAVNLKDSSVCTTDTMEPQSCYYDVAVTKPSLTDCNYVTDDLLHRECIAIVTLNVSKCYSFPDNFSMSNCIFQLALAKKDPGLCKNTSSFEPVCLEDVSAGFNVSMD